MRFDQYFESTEQKQVKGQFASLIRIANADGVIGEYEEKMLHKMAKQFRISDIEFQEMLNNNSRYEFYPPISKLDRYTRFVNIMRVISADGNINDFEMRALKRFAAGIDIPREKVEHLVEKSTEALEEGKDVDDIVEMFDSWMK